MVAKIDMEKFRALFEEDEEFAVIDPRPEHDFSLGHLLAASNLPLARLQYLIQIAVPQKNTLCVLYDTGGSEASRAAHILSTLDYNEIVILEGGLIAWEQSGGAIFSGVSVPGKAFGEYVELSSGTPVMTATELNDRLQLGSAPLLIDARTMEEHESYCIPGAVYCGGAELLYRVASEADFNQEIVVHCGGRTRSILGAQTLIDSGFNHVSALENGTMAWQAEGFELETGSRDSLPVPDSARVAAIQAKAAELAEKWYVDRVHSITRID
jgi:rhodanese-related sulfurtransferase